MPMFPSCSQILVMLYLSVVICSLSDLIFILSTFRQQHLELQINRSAIKIRRYRLTDHGRHSSDNNNSLRMAELTYKITS